MISAKTITTVALLAFPIILTVFGFSFSFASSQSAVSPVTPGTRPMIRSGPVGSTNWAGYAVTGAPGSVTDVKGSWTVPTLACTSSSTYVAFWVGIDGFSDSTVEQTGVLGQCSGGSAIYSAWYEFYPQPMFTVSGFTVKSGDTVSAEVSATSGGRFTVTLLDGSNSFSKTVSDHSAQMASAEWITEAPSSGGSILPLSNFGTVGFGYDNTHVSSTSYATISGLGVSGSQPIGAYPSGTLTCSSASSCSIASNGSFQITMVSSSTNPGGAQPSALSNDGTSFTVAYVPPSGTTTTTSSTTSAVTSSTATTSTSSSSLSVSATTDASSYTQNSWVYITVTVTSSGTAISGATVAVSITTPNNGGVSSGSGTTGSNGVATFKYRISHNAPLGMYTVDASASASGYISNSGSTTFTVN